MSLVKIDVTAEDIANGVPSNCGKCPIALALLRVVPSPIVLNVDGDSVSFCLPSKPSGLHPHAASDLPFVAQWFVQDFDNGQPVVPFSFDFWMPDEVAA